MDPEISTIPLPENPFPARPLSAAYNRCFELEAKPPNVEHHPPPIICARLLGHLLRLAPPGEGQRQLQQGISTAKDDMALMQLGTFYHNHFIRAFRCSSGRIPSPSSHPSSSCPSFEDVREYFMATMEGCKLDCCSARHWAMRRDDYRCMITGRKDLSQPDGSSFVQAAHIIPLSLSTDIEEHSDKNYQSAGVWSVLRMFTKDNITENLAGNRIHCLENVVSMNAYCHMFFDALYLWLKPIEGAPHKYRVCVAKESVKDEFPNLPEYVTLSTTTTLPLPNHEYLALHALCCEVARMSGAVEYIEEIERRMDDTRALAGDGSNANLLTTALSLVEAH